MKTRSIVVLLAVVAMSWAAHTQTQKPARPLTTTRLRDNLYVIAGEGGNVAMLVTSEGVVLVDDMFYRNHDDMLAAIKAVTSQPLRYVINTHQHDDHAGGDALMLPIAEVIAHKNVRANLVAHRTPYFEDTPGTPIGLPRITFSDETSVFLGGQEVRALWFGRGHTSGDAIVYFPDLKVIHTGDLFLMTGAARAGARTFPPGSNLFVDSSQGGSLMEWTRTLDGALALDVEAVIPGHGPVATKNDVRAFRNGVAAMQAHLLELVRSGISREDLAKRIEMEYGWRATGCPPSPPTPGCLQYQQLDALMRELGDVR
ncbi:MAG TPA: MBL fold metallo-hydrolase [Vicinamibacterales bacterium]|nr:MBL fold metallo-hydrolase [Vicinamibacterales bacterium]